MTPAPADKSNLQISCPSCSQRFRVGPELMGKTVECGSCESRFEVTEDLLVKGAKFYPGERDGAALNQFRRAPGEVIPARGWQPAGVLPQQEKGYFSPISKVSRFQLMVGWIGVLLVLALAYFLGFDEGGAIKELATSAKLIIALFGGLVALGMISYANPRNRLKTLRIATIFTVIVLAVPFIFNQKPLAPVVETARETLSKQAIAPEDSEVTSVDGLRKLIGTEPLEAEIKRLAELGGTTHAYGVWLRDLNDSNRLPIRDYLLRATGADPASHIFPREGRDYLMVVTGVDISLDELAAIVARVGRTQKIHRELNVIESQVDAGVFIQGPLDKLTDSSSQSFYDLNKRELESVQLDRVSGAVKRLADAEPKIYREDITRQLIVLLTVDQVDFPGEVCKALLVWAQDVKQAGPAAEARLNSIVAAKKPVPRELIELLAKAGSTQALPTMEKLWMDDATAWEPLFENFGAIAEPGLLARFPELKGTMRHSAVRILTVVGTKASLPVLEKARNGAEIEMQILIDNAEKAIKGRP